LDQGSTNDNLRELRDAGEWEPMGIQAAPADEAVSKDAVHELSVDKSGMTLPGTVRS
jgi:hypothetical protein